MKISSLHIHQYKSVTDPFHLEEPGKLHIFIGPNNAGKTNLLDAISQLYQVNPGRLKYTQTRLEITFELFDSANRTLQLQQHGSNKVFTIAGKQITAARAKQLLAKHIMRISALAPQKTTELKQVYESFRTGYPRRFGEFERALQDHFPKIKLSKSFFDESVIHEAGNERTYERLGAGFKQIFVILLYLYSPQYSILLLEEPEIHLHPALVKRLFDVIEAQSESNQIFLTTHSPLFIRPHNLHRVFRVTRGEDSTHVHSPRLAGHHINYNRLKQELNAENLEMFFADTVLLVEGSSDKILMRGLIDRFYPGDKDIKVIQTYGKSNVDVYVELLVVFDVPYLVLLDRDALYDTGIKLLQKQIHGAYTKTERTLVNRLKKSNVFVLPNGSIEKNYPRKYQRHRKRKPQNALYAAHHITAREYQSPQMQYLREVIEHI